MEPRSKLQLKKAGLDPWHPINHLCVWCGGEVEWVRAGIVIEVGRETDSVSDERHGETEHDDVLQMRHGPQPLA